MPTLHMHFFFVWVTSGPRIEQPLPEDRRWRHMLDMPDYVYERKFREGNKHRVHILM